MEPRELTETGKWLSTCHNLSKLIPFYCGHLKEYSDAWTNYDSPSGEDAESLGEIQHEIKVAIKKFLLYTESNVIKKTIALMNRHIIKQLYELMPIQFRGFFEYQGAQFPMELSNPIPFFPCQRNKGNIFLPKPIILKRGKTTIKIRNVLCSTYDLKAWVALCQIRKRNICLVKESSRSFVIYPQYAEIAKELGLQNPKSELVCENIRRRLERLRDMGLTWEYGKKFYDSSLIHLSTNLDEDSEFNIEIHLDKFWIDQMQSQFNSLDAEILYSLPGRLTNLYVYLNYDKGFKQYGEFQSKNYKQYYWDVYKDASLRSPYPLSKEISIAKIRNELFSCLEELMERNVISDFSFKNNYLSVSNID